MSDEATLNSNVIDFASKVLSRTQNEALKSRLLTEQIDKRNELRKQLEVVDAEIKVLILDLGKTMKQADIARITGITRQRISQMLNKRENND